MGFAITGCMKNTSKIEKKSMKSPDEILEIGKGKVEITKVGETSIGRVYLPPGWSYEEHLKPIMKTESCQEPHTQYVISGRVRVKMDDGAEEEFGPGDVGYVPPGHKTWIVGNEPYVAVEFRG